MWYNTEYSIVYGTIYYTEIGSDIKMKADKIIEIAVMVAGIDEEYQNSVIEGINSSAVKYNVNVTYFSAFGGVMTNSLFDVGEYNIYKLINYDKFDAAILLTNTISDDGEKKKIIDSVKNAGIPAVVLDCDDYPEFYNVMIDNNAAMKEIVRHIIAKHNAKTINYVSGPLVNPEAEDRYNAFCSVLDEYGLELDEKRVFYGEFRALDGVHAVEHFIRSGLSMPDAIICANDAMALAVVMTLEEYGYDVPKDVMVTGFDNTYSARHYCPAITSVSRPLSNAGELACEMLVKILSGEKYDKTVRLSSEPVFSESCGCVNNHSEDIVKYKKSMLRTLENCRYDIKILDRLTSDLAESETSDDNIRTIGKYFHKTGCKQYALCLCSEWDSTLRESWEPESSDLYQVDGYTEKMSAPLIYNDGTIISVESFESKDIYPVPFKDGGNISYILPLHFRERCLGYYIMSNGDFPTKSLICHSLMMNISNSIENIRKLIHLNSVIEELDKLYVVDPLCGIYNRNGFIRNADSVFREMVESHDKLLISFIDMDGLKLINDNYGHKEGDFALRKLAEVIQNCCFNGRICSRFGGDEFIIFGKTDSDDDVIVLENEFKRQLAAMNAIISKPYSIDASIGTIVSTVEPDMKLFSLITKADQIMYERKKKKKTSRYLRR